MSWAMRVLTEDDLDHIAAHKYSPGVYTPLDYRLSPFWQAIAEALPVWLAPNLITFIGFTPLVLVYALSWYVCPFCDTAPPQWLAFSYVAALYFYQTMDAVDGKQARRTGSSTPMGHLVDHGCDCLTGMTQHAALSMILMPGDMRWVIHCMRSIQIPIFLSAWSDRHTGIFPTSLDFGAFQIGCTELQFALMSGVLVAGVAGPEVWQSWLTTKLELPWAADSVRLLIMKVWLLQAFGMALNCMATVLREAGASSLKDLIPVALLNLLFGLWHPGWVSASGRLICLFTGLSLFFMNAQMIVFTMARTEFRWLQWVLLPYGVAVAASWALPREWSPFLLFCFTAAFGSWLLWWLLSVVQQLKAKLGIYAFCITQKYQVEDDLKKKSS